jgi:subtilisin family serine protease
LSIIESSHFVASGNGAPDHTLTHPSCTNPFILTLNRLYFAKEQVRRDFMGSKLRLLAMALPWAWVATSAAASDNQASGQYLKFRDEKSLEHFLKTNTQAERIHRGLLWVEVKNDAGILFTQQQAEGLGIVLQETGRVSYRIPKPEKALSTASETPNTKLWGISKVNAPVAWNTTKGSRDVVVAVVDTGIDFEHPALRDNMWVNSVELNGRAGIDDDGNGYVDDIHGADFIGGAPTPMDDEGHGSHVAGTIAGNMPSDSFYGVAPGVRLMAIKTHNKDGEGSKTSVVKGILYAADMGARVLNCSWGGAPEAAEYDQMLFDAIEYANKKGSLLVAAAGNESDNNDIDPRYPTNYDLPGIISVAASDKLDRRAYFSNFGVKTVDLAAPGLAVWSVEGGSSSFTSLSGTSMAAPHVAGAAALLASTPSGQSMTAAQLRETLVANVEAISEWRNRVISGGRLDLRFLGKK